MDAHQSTERKKHEEHDRIMNLRHDSNSSRHLQRWAYSCLRRLIKHTMLKTGLLLLTYGERSLCFWRFRLRPDRKGIGQNLWFIEIVRITNREAKRRSRRSFDRKSETPVLGSISLGWTWCFQRQFGVSEFIMFGTTGSPNPLKAGYRKKCGNRKHVTFVMWGLTKDSSS